MLYNKISISIIVFYGELMIFKKETIAQGIRFYAIDSNKFKASVLTFSLTLPLTPEAVAYDLLLSGLLRRGTVKYPSLSSLNRSLDELYGSYVEVRSSNVGDNISFTVSSEILDNKYVPDGTDTLGGVIEIASELMLHPLFRYDDFPAELFEQERKIVIDTLKSECNNTRAYSVRRCLELLRRGSSHPTLEQLRSYIENATPADVRDHYIKMISSAPLDVFYVGATPSAIIKKRIIDTFGTHHFTNERKLLPITPTEKREFVSSCEKMPVSQGKLTMGFNCGACVSKDDRLYYTALLLNEIFGGSASSKLFLNVRERMGLCYYCSSSYSIYTGFMTVSSGIDPKKLETVKSAILEQLEQIKLGNISEEELSNAKKSLANAYEQLYDSPLDLQAFYSGRLLFGIGDTVEDCRKIISGIGIEEISALAKQTVLEATFFVEGTKTDDEEEIDPDE